MGIFNGSSEVELGNDVEFRSGVELAYKFRNKIRVGIAIFHLSKGVFLAKIQVRNRWLFRYAYRCLKINLMLNYFSNKCMVIVL